MIHYSNDFPNNTKRSISEIFNKATIQFGQTVYGGVVDFVEGGTEETDKTITISDLFWYSGANGLFYSAVVSDIKHGDGRYDHCIAECYRTMNYAHSGSLSNGEMSVDSNGRIQLIDTRYSTTSEFTAAMGDMKLCYELATPTQLSTPPTLLKMLKGTNNLTADGVMQIGYQPDNVIGHTLEVAEDYTDKAVGKNILPMTLAGIKAANPYITWTDETSFTIGNVTVTFQVAGGDIYGIHVVSTGSSGEFFNLCFEGVDYSRFDGCILSGCDVNDESKIYIAIRKYGGADYFAKNISGDTVINYTADQKASIFVYLSSGSVDTVLKPMIRKPNMDNTYEPPKPSKEILMDLIAYLFTQI